MDGYEIVAKEVRAYWNKNGVSDVVCLLRLDGYPIEVIAFAQSDYDYEDVTFENDFWEGEEKIEIELITPLWKVLEFYRDHVKKEDVQ